MKLLKENKRLNETWKGEDVIDDLADRAQSLLNDGGYGDKEDCVRQAIDDGLIYTRDIWDLAEHYGVVEDSELINRYYEDLFNDVYSKVEDVEDEEEETEEDHEEAVAKYSKKEESLKSHKELNESITVELDEDEALDMLMNRVEEFGGYHPGDIEYKLYEKMYENYIENGLFDGAEFNVMTIVDNDIVNYCTIIGPEDENYQTIVDLYDTQGLGDISSESDYSYIEAVEKEDGKNYFLLRY